MRCHHSMLPFHVISDVTLTDSNKLLTAWEIVTFDELRTRRRPTGRWGFSTRAAAERCLPVLIETEASLRR